MRTTIIIENGKVSVSVDDSSPTIIQKLRGGGDSNEAAAHPEPKSAAPHHKRPKVVESKPVPTKNGGVKRTCEICGDDITTLDKRRKICQKSTCIKEKNRVFMQKWWAKKRGKSAAEPAKVEEKQVGYCKHCQAYTTHDTAHHIVPKPVFLPGHEKTPEEIESWRPKPANTDDSPVKYADTDIPASDFTDPWDCDACRRRSHLCPLHQSLSDDGKTPPKHKKAPDGKRR